MGYTGRRPWTVGISATDSEAEIRYTIDGSVPTAQSNLYTAPVTINATWLLRAAEVKADTLCSAVTTASYIFVEFALSQPNDPVGYPAEAVYRHTGYGHCRL